MQFYRALYFSPNIENHGKAKRSIQHHAGSLSLYVVTLCDESLTKRRPRGAFVWGDEKADGGRKGGQLQFFHNVFLKQKAVREHCPMIIGIADGKSGAAEIVRQIVDETREWDGDYDVVRFLAKRDSRIRAGEGDGHGEKPEKTAETGEAAETEGKPAQETETRGGDL